MRAWPSRSKRCPATRPWSCPSSATRRSSRWRCSSAGFGSPTSAGCASRKGRELAANPRAAGTLYWRETLQQVTVEGPVRRLSEEESDAIFGERPADAQATALASRQGEPLEDPEALREAANVAAKEPLRRPGRWGGWRLDPDLVEFWHGSPDRLHRRLLYIKGESGWQHKRLQP